MNKTALITGASSGIGWELAKLFAADGYDLVLAARNEDKLLELAEIVKEGNAIEARVLTCDLSDPGVPESVYEFLAMENISIDVLVNNAGFGVFGDFAGADWKALQDMMQVNMTSLVELTHRFLPGMIERGWGRVLNVASTAAFQPGPLMNIYYASKAFVLHFSEALGEELRGTGVAVTAFCPGLTRTDFHNRAGIKKFGTLERVYMPADGVARIGYEGMKSGKSIVIPGLTNRLMVRGVRFAPRRWVTKSVARLQKGRR
jgi:short-subunit dehydrogenase